MVKMGSLLMVVLAGLVAAEEMKMEMNANPMRRVVTMLQMMSKKVEAEGEKGQEMFEKFMCYCKTSMATLAQSIEDAETKIPQLESDLKEAESSSTQLTEDIATHKADRDAANEAVSKATAIREKEAGEFAKESSEDKSNLAAMEKALAAIEKGMAGSFLQTNAAAVLRRLTMSQEMSNGDRDLLASFLSEGSSQQYAPASGEIVGILKQMKDTMASDLAEIEAQESEAKAGFEGLVAVKEKEIAAAQEALESKMKRSGEIAVEIVNLKEDLDDTKTSLAEDKQFLADLEKNCATKEAEWEGICKTRQEELIAIADTIKILNDDDALDLFKKAVPAAGSASLLQLQVSSKDLRTQALHALSGARAGDHNTGLDLIALALHGKKVDFNKVLGMIDDMVVILGKEQVDDDDKKAYCEAEFDAADDKKKALERKISDLEKAIEEMTEMSATLASDIKALEEGIVALDKSVALATEQRKDEHADYVQSLAENNAVMGIIDIAKNRLNKFYNPKMYKAPPKRELTEEERITLNMGGTLAPTNPPAGIAGTGVTAFVQVHTFTQEVDAPAPPPETATSHKGAKEESGGVIAMMDMMKADVAKETQEMEFEEKDAQEDYEKMVNDAAAKRAADTKSIEEKTAAKANLEVELVRSKDQKGVEEADLMATKEYIASLHADCDWLIANFELRKGARAGEIDALKKAKAVLSGADYSLVQTSRKSRKTSQPLGHPPPTPAVDEPATMGEDKAYNTKDDACQSCKFYASQSCAMYKTCLCHSTNAFFGIAGLPKPSDQDNWHWACAAAGDKYTPCFQLSEVTGGSTAAGQDKAYQDNFGDMVDPNKPKCPV